MVQRVIPILPGVPDVPQLVHTVQRPTAASAQPDADRTQASPGPRLLGNLPHAQRVLTALQDAAHSQDPPPDWLQELRVDKDEACAVLAPTLAGEQGLCLAQTTFETLRRLLPDTDIYVRSARR